MRRSVGLALVLVCGVASAQPKSKSTELFEQGRELAKAGKLEAACSKFGESWDIERAPGTALNYGDCLEKLGDLRRAWRMYDTAARDFARDKDSRASYAQSKATSVATKLASITVRLADPLLAGLSVTVGGDTLKPASEVHDKHEPGDVLITAIAPGHTEFTTTVKAELGAIAVVEIPATLGGAIVGGGASEPEPAPTGGRDKSRVRLSLITGGVGLAATVTSVVLGLSARSAYNAALERCPDDSGRPVCQTSDDLAKIESAGTRADIATGFAIAGGVLVGAAVVLYFTAPRESLQITPSASPSGGGVTFSGRF